MANKSHKPTHESRIEVATMARVGVPHHDMAVLIGISIHTLLKHYDPELKRGKAECNYNIGRKIYSMAIGGDKTMLCFIAKCQMGWRETTQVQQLGKDGKPVDPGEPKKIYVIAKEEADKLRDELDKEI